MQPILLNRTEHNWLNTTDQSQLTPLTEPNWLHPTYWTQLYWPSPTRRVYWPNPTDRTLLYWRNPTPRFHLKARSSETEPDGNCSANFLHHLSTWQQLPMKHQAPSLKDAMARRKQAPFLTHTFLILLIWFTLTSKLTCLCWYSSFRHYYVLDTVEARSDTTSPSSTTSVQLPWTLPSHTWIPTILGSQVQNSINYSCIVEVRI